MTVMTDMPKASFRPSMLIYDTRYRSLTIQVVFLVLLSLFLWWLVANTIHNLALKDKDFDFGFLSVRAGYDINQTLIPYTNDSTHGRALLVGLLNTLYLAFLCCILATVIGVIAGILRLSKNWIVSRLIAIYIETFRNVPVVLWIVLVNAIMSISMPEPKEFRGETPNATMILFDSVAVTNRGVYMPGPVFSRSLGYTEIGPINLDNDVLAILAVLFASIWGYRKNTQHRCKIPPACGLSHGGNRRRF